MTNSRINWFLVSATLAFCSLFIWVFIWLAVGVVANQKCLDRGYRSYEVSPDYTIYCIRREKGSDVVRPLKEIK